MATTITIQKGDTLSALAKKHGTTVNELASLNNIANPNKISAGKTLQLPGAQAAAPAAPAATNPATPGSGILPSEADIRAQAEAMFEPAFKQSMVAIDSALQTYDTRYGQNLTDYNKYVDDLMQTTEQSILDSAIKRGMGRSSRTTYEMSEALAGIGNEAQTYRRNIEQDRMDFLNQLEGQRMALTQTKQDSVMNQVMQLNQYYESVRQFNEQMALREKELSLMSNKGGGGGGGGGGGFEWPTIEPQQTNTRTAAHNNTQRAAARKTTTTTTTRPATTKAMYR